MKAFGNEGRKLAVGGPAWFVPGSSRPFTMSLYLRLVSPQSLHCALAARPISTGTFLLSTRGGRNALLRAMLP